ncbi:F-box protein At3g26010-like [Papaver somniferum]|uniref:F-box protein At3g26010-like n=1 Tax=Papaver somniferum TaxID=3469 RepID=UPI000E6FEB45|nr:F-box protein At3g26010-like [Papaver somniferum]
MSYQCADEKLLKSEISYPDLHSDFMSRNEHLFSFKFLTNQKPFQEDNLRVLGSSNGLVLCYSVQSDDMMRYHVCNPLTQQWVSLPSPPPPRARGLDVIGIFCEYSSSFTSCCYKVVRIPLFDESYTKEFNVDIFSSEMGVWERFQVSCDKLVQQAWSILDKVVILDGVLFWIEGRNRMLVYNFDQKNKIDEHRCSLISLPDEEFDDYYKYRYSESILGESGGWVCYAKIKISTRDLTVSVWVLDGVNWKILHNKISTDDSIFKEMLSRIGVSKEMLSRTGEFARIQVLGFSPMDRNVVLLGCKHCVWGFNIQTRSFEELYGDKRHVDHTGRMFLPSVLTPMPTVLPPPSWIDT